MKKLIHLVLISGFLFMAGHANAQFRRIPGIVTDSFKVKYPNAQSVTWEDKLTNFQASFNMDGEKYTAKYSSKGEWLSSQKKIKKESLPEAVKDGLSKSKYATWEVGTVTVNFLPGNVTQYGVFVSKSDLNRKNLLFSNDGQLLKDNTTL